MPVCWPVASDTGGPALNIRAVIVQPGLCERPPIAAAPVTSVVVRTAAMATAVVVELRLAMWERVEVRARCPLAATRMGRSPVVEDGEERRTELVARLQKERLVVPHNRRGRARPRLLVEARKDKAGRSHEGLGVGANDQQRRGTRTALEPVQVAKPEQLEVIDPLQSFEPHEKPSP